MELGKQIKKNRQELKLSQDELADKVYVTRQSISNWENDKTYPDINSLLLLSTLFHISLDELVKGDLEEMREEIRREDVQVFEKESKIFVVLLVLSIVLLAPMFYFFKWYGIIAWAILYGITLYRSLKVEKLKKQHDIQTYKEIVAFSEGKRLDEIEKVKERAIRPYQKVLLSVIFAVVGFAIAFLTFYWFL